MFYWHDENAIRCAKTWSGGRHRHRPDQIPSNGFRLRRAPILWTSTQFCMLECSHGIFFLFVRSFFRSLSLLRCVMDAKKANLFTYNYLWIILLLFLSSLVLCVLCLKLLRLLPVGKAFSSKGRPIRARVCWHRIMISKTMKELKYGNLLQFLRQFKYCYNELGELE